MTKNFLHALHGISHLLVTLQFQPSHVASMTAIRSEAPPFRARSYRATTLPSGSSSPAAAITGLGEWVTLRHPYNRSHVGSVVRLKSVIAIAAKPRAVCDDLHPSKQFVPPPSEGANQNSIVAPAA